MGNIHDKNINGELEKCYGKKFTKKMINYFQQDCYGRYEDEYIKQWTAQARSGMKEGSKKRKDENTSMDDFIFKSKKSKQGTGAEEIMMDVADTDVNSELTSSRLGKDLQKIGEKSTSVDDVSNMNVVDAEFIPSCFKTKTALVDKCKKVGINCFVKDKPGEILLTRKALEEDISVCFQQMAFERWSTCSRIKMILCRKSENC